ncbi:hypothetical protein [Planktotalea sp.]|uniref:hypothetical protein n=1 Tax=Planktotalea sp. TaxID=2029877 RepID=UPI0025D8D286|nr:hypothetical protein [Planktotalea sp.]
MIPLTHLTVLATCGALIAMPAFANAKLDEICEAFGDASVQIALLRADGVSEMDAQLAFAKDNEKSPLLAMQLVPYVSSYIYGLTKEQLLEDVKTPFVEQCNAANG